MMTDFVALLGVKGGPAIRPGSNMPTSILVSMGGARVLVDAGLGAARGVCDLGVSLMALDGVVITHLHSDHYLELGPLLHTAWTAGLNRTIPVYGPPGLQRYWDGFLSAMGADIGLRIADEGRPDLAKLVSIHPIDRDGEMDIAGLTMSAMLNDHPPFKHSYALRLSGGGHSAVLSGDTAYMPEMGQFARDADLLVHEAMLVKGVDALIRHTPNGDERLRRHILRAHTAAEDVGRVATEAGVAHLALNHLVPDGLPGFTEEDWIDAVRKTWSGRLTIGKDGARLDL